MMKVLVSGFLAIFCCVTSAHAADLTAFTDAQIQAMDTACGPHQKPATCATVPSANNRLPRCASNYIPDYAPGYENCGRMHSEFLARQERAAAAELAKKQQADGAAKTQQQNIDQWLTGMMK